MSGQVWGVIGLDHVQVSCPAGSEDRMRAFYVGVLGMVWFVAGSCEIHCGVEEPFTPARKAHPGLVVADLDALAERVAAAGAPVRWDDNLPGVRRFHTDAPVGNRLELQAVR